MNNLRLLMQVDSLEFPTLRSLPYFCTESEEQEFYRLKQMMPHTVKSAEEEKRRNIMKSVIATEISSGVFDQSDPFGTVLPSDYNHISDEDSE